MMLTRLILGSAALAGLSLATATAQLPETSMAEPVTESSTFPQDAPLDDIVRKSLVVEKPVLPYEPVRENDIFWEKRVWRVVDTREKMNHTFSYPERPFASILLDAAMNGDITVYSQEDDRFSYPLTAEEVAAKTSTIDTIESFDPETYESTLEVIQNDLNPEDIKRFRMKEVWYFDEESSTMDVRILGIAPLRDIFDEDGTFLYEDVMFWVYYPEAREVLARERVFNIQNDASLITWEDLLEMRRFSSYIWKESNVRDRRLQDYLSGVDLLLEGEKIKQEIFNFEQDLWSY